MSIPNLPDVLGGKSSDKLTGEQKLFGGITLAGIVAMLGVGAYKALPYVLNFLGMAIDAGFKMLVLGGLAAVIGAIVYILMMPRTWTLFQFWFETLSRKATVLFVKHNAVDTLYAFIAMRKKDFQEFVDAYQDVIKERNNADQLLEEKQSDFKKLELNCTRLKARSFDSGKRIWVNEDDHNHFNIASQKASILENSIKNIKKRKERVEFLVKIGEKMQRGFKFIIETTEFFVEELVSELKATDSMAKASGKFMGAVTGDDKQAVFKMATDYTQDTISSNWAKIENFKNLAGEVISTMELSGEAAEFEMMQKLQLADETADQMILEGTDMKGRDISYWLNNAKEKEKEKVALLSNVITETEKKERLLS